MPFCCFSTIDTTFSLTKYEALGPMSYQEKMVLAHFVVLTLLWVLRKPLVILGWGDLFEPAQSPCWC